MGRFGIGARVRDLDGDLATVIENPGSGKRVIRFDDPWLSQSMTIRKKFLTLVEAAPAAQEPAESWVPKVGDRVNWTRDRGDFDGATIESPEGLIFDWKLRATNGNSTYAYSHELEPAPLPVAEQPAGLVVEADKFYRDTDGKSVGPMIAYCGGYVEVHGDGRKWNADGSAVNEHAALVIAPLTIEASKFYRTRDGRKVGPVTTRTEDGKTYFIADGYHYNASGECGYEGVCTPEEDYRRQHDLVAEWVDEPVVAAIAAAVPEATTDEVVLKLEAGATYIGASGAQHVVEANEGNESWPFKTANVPHETSRFWRADGTAYNDDHWNKHAAVGDQLVSRLEPAAPPAKFKVGDRVRSVEDYGSIVKAGDEGEVAGFWRDGVKVLHSSGLRSCFERRIEPAPAPSAATPAESFIVARLTPSGLPRPSARPRVHTSLVAAENEAQRLADRLGDEFAVYQRVSSKTVDAGPVPGKDNWLFDAALAKEWIANRGGEPRAGMAFSWGRTSQGFEFWSRQNGSLTPSGRAILRKWIAEVESSTDKVAA